jgi:hypothetical protein
MSFAEWVEDFRWAMNAKRARKWRRKLLFSQRQRFDDALRPKRQGGFIAYPDALYEITIDDLLRAMTASVTPRFGDPPVTLYGDKDEGR